MSEIGPIQPAAPTATQRSKPPVSVPATSASAPRPGDQVELSDQARLLSQLSSMPDVRQGMIDLAKSRVESGFYDNEAVIDQTIDKMAHEIAG